MMYPDTSNRYTHPLPHRVVLSISWIAIILQVIPFVFFSSPQGRIYWLGLGITGTIGTIIAWWFSERGSQQVAFFSLLTLLTAIFLGSVLIGGGVSVMGLTVYLMMLTLLGYVLRPYQILLFAVACAFIAGAIFVIFNQQDISNLLIEQREMRLLMLLNGFVIMTAIIYMIVQSQHKLRQTAEEQEQALLDESLIRLRLETRMTQLLDTLPIAMLAFNADGVVTSAEGRCMIEQDDCDIIGKPLSDIFPQADIQTDIEQALAGVTFDAIRQHSDGKYRHSFYYPIKQDDSLKEVLVIMLDVSDRMRVASELLVSEARFKQLTEQAPYTILIEDVNTHQIMYSNTIQIGQHRLEAGMDLYQWFTQNVSEAHQHTLMVAWSHRRQDDTTVIEVPIKNAEDHDLLWLTCRIAMLEQTSNDESPLYLWYLSDITERKRSEQAIASAADQFQTMFEEALDVIIIVDAKQNILRLNSAIRNTLGYAPAELLGTSFNNLLVSDDDDALSGGRQDQYIMWKAVPIWKADGDICPMEITATLLPWESDTAVMLTLRDLSARLLIEQEIQTVREMQEAARQQAELLDAQQDILFTIAHQLRNPLAVIQLSTQFIQRYGDRLKPDQREEHLGKVLNNTRQLKRMMEDMLAARSAVDGKLPFHPEPNDFCALCERIFADVRDSQANAQHVFKLDNQINRCNTMIDDSLIVYVLDNLLGNAVRYSPEGGQIRMSMYEDGDDFVVTVSDEGIGIPPEAMTHIFDMFYRADNVQKIKGTGIGLGLAQRSAIAHGGSLNVESTVGEGTTFTLRLPIDPIGG